MKKTAMLSLAVIFILSFSANQAFAGSEEIHIWQGTAAGSGETTILSYSTSAAAGTGYYVPGQTHVYYYSSSPGNCPGSCPPPQYYGNCPPVRTQGRVYYSSCPPPPPRYNQGCNSQRIISHNERGYWTQGAFYHHGYYKPPTYHPYRQGWPRGRR